jgi:biopolymer transport protein ExbD
MLIRRNRNETPGLNTTSTADISFMLLIFFLVTTSMDVDKGLLRQLPSPEPQKKEQQESVVDKNSLMAIHLTAGDTLLVNNQPMKLEDLKQETVRFVHRLGKKHLISIESDRDANYNLYFQMQNELMEAYAQLRNEAAQKKYHREHIKQAPRKGKSIYFKAFALSGRMNKIPILFFRNNLEDFG